MAKKKVYARLRTQVVHVQRDRVIDLLRRVDYIGIQTRMKIVLQRRQYHVTSPNVLWHLDGYHKLIRWKVGINGYIMQ